MPYTMPNFPGQLRFFHKLAHSAFVSLLSLTLLAGCGWFGSQAAAPTALPTRTPLPTFTPTPLSQLSATETATPETATPETATPETPPASLPAQTPPATALLTISAEAVNVRSLPSTTAALVGMASAGQQFAVSGRTSASDWWQVCCIDSQPGWVFADLVAVTGGELAPVVETAPPDPAPQTAAPQTAAPQPAAPPPDPAAQPAAPPPDPAASSAGFFDPNAQYQIVAFKVLGLEENNGGIRDSTAQHHIFLTVLDPSGSGVDGAVVRNLVGDRSEVVTGSKGPGKAEITMYYEPFKLTVVADPSGPVSSQISNQMGLVFPHLPDLVGKLGDVNYEYGACPTLEIRCQWPISAIHFSYEITFQKVR